MLISLISLIDTAAKSLFCIRHGCHNVRGKQIISVPDDLKQKENKRNKIYTTQQRDNDDPFARPYCIIVSAIEFIRFCIVLRFGSIVVVFRMLLGAKTNFS